MQTATIRGFQLSPQQKRLWQLQQKSSAYLTQFSLLLEGNLQLEILKAAVQQTINRHSILRTIFSCLSGKKMPVMVVENNCLPMWQDFDLSSWEEQQQSAKIEEIFQKERSQDFDLEKGSLLHCYLLKLSQNRHILLISLPALCADTWTIKNIVAEIGVLYSDSLENQESENEEIMQYLQVSEWQNQLLADEEAETANEYWHQQRFSVSDRLKLPWEKNPEPRSPFYPESLREAIPPEVTAKIVVLAEQYDTSPQVVLLACWQILIWRLTGEQDTIIGRKSDRREYEELEDVLGLFATWLPIKRDLLPDLPLCDLLELNQATIDRDEEWEDYFVPESVENIDTLIFPFGFEFDELPEKQFAGSVSFSLDRQYSCIEPFKVKLSCTQNKEFLNVDFYYDVNYFSVETIQTLSRQFQTLLVSATKNPEATIGQLEILTKSDRQQLLIEFNQTQVDYPKDVCIHDFFAAQVEKTPDNIAVVFEEQQLTYAELNARANQLARYLQRQGVKPETLVGVYLERSPLVIVSILGILKAGGAYLPLDHALATSGLDFRLQDAQAVVLLTQDKLVKNLPENTPKVVCLDTKWAIMAQEASDNPSSEVTPENLVYTIYTSGSTGEPKGVAIEHQQLLNYLHSIQGILNLPSGSSFANVSTFAADLGNTVIFPSLCSGGCLHIISSERVPDPQALADYFQNHPIDCLKIVPSHLEALLTYEHPEKIIPRQRLILGGEATSWNLIEQVRKVAPECRIINHYGPTEATVGVTTFAVETTANSISSATVPIGKPIANAQIYLLDPEKRPVPMGVAGELYIGGAGLARGYLNQPQLTADKFIAHPFAEKERLYRTGDLARYLSDGNIEFIGRTDYQVKIRGFRIELGEIESVLSSHPQIQQAIVIATGEVPTKKRLVAYIVTSKGAIATNQLREFILSKVPDYMIPSTFVNLEAFPLTPNGKVDRKALPAPEVEVTREQEYVAPRTANEEIIANLFAKVLGLQNVGIHDNFFELGGHSLLATQLISRLRETFSVEIPLQIVFESPNVAELDQKLRELCATNSGLSLPTIQPRTQSKQLPLSWAQERLWFLNKLEGATATYNRPEAVRIKGKLDINALKQTLSEIVRRHEVLRTSFHIQDGKPIQLINPHTTTNINLVDLQQLELTEHETIVLQEAKKEATTPFNLEIAPLLRCSLLQLSTTESVLLLTMHHIVSDGWSIGIFIQELSTLYQAFAQGKSSPLPELPIQYADFAVWQRQYLSGEVLLIQLNYWKQNLANAPELLQLPTDHPRPTAQTYQGTTQSWTLDTELTQKLQNLSRQNGTTLFMTLLAGFATLLYRYSGQSDILIGSPIANRNRSEIESLIGFFVNTLVLRTAFVDNPSFEELLGQVRETTLKAYQHQDVPFEQVVEALQPQRSLSHSPLFQVMFILQNAPMGEVELPDVSLSVIQSQRTIAKFDLTLSMSETESGLVGEWEYNTDLFDSSTIERMTVHFQNLLSAMVENPAQKVNELSLLSAEERHQLLVEWNNTDVEYPKDKCIHQLFEEQVEKNPDAVAVVFKNKQLTYKQLNQKANQLAHYLKNLGVGADILVGICLERSVEMVVGLLAILKAGGAYVPIDPNYPPERISLMLSDSQASVLLTQKHLAASLPEVQTRVLCIDTEETFTHQSWENPARNIDTENLAYVIYTSGSTGKPKGVQIPHRTLLNFLTSMQQQPGITKDDVLLAVTTISFDIAGLEIYLPLISGARVVLANRDVATDGKQLAELISVSGTTMMQATPATWRLLLASGWQGSENLKILCGGEALPTDLAGELLSSGNSLWNMYGPTETTIWSTVCQVKASQLELTSIPIGRPIANTQVYILDNNHQPVPMGVAGELHIGGLGLARGYFNRPELTLEKFIANPFDNNNSKLYKTGDLARYLPDGNIEYLGRIDNQVKIRGFRIELGEIEVVLDRHPAVQQAVVTAQEYNPGDKRLVAYLVCHSEQPTTEELRSFVKNQLPNYMIPSAFVILEAFPLTANGKINRRALKPTTDLGSAENSFVPPSTTVEKQLATIWSEVLGIEKVGIHDNFFDIGGHSLLIIQVQNRLQEIFSSNVTIADLFRNPTISTLAQIVEQTSATQIPESQLIQPVSRQLKLPLSFSQQRLWFIDQLEKTAAYNMLLSTRLHGVLNLDTLEQAFTEMIRRHEVLRTSFQVVNGEAAQIISETSDFSLSVIDWRELPQSKQEEQIQELGLSEARRPFDLSKNPLLRVTLLQLTDREYVLVFVIHHIISDEWSLGIMIKELATLYDAFSRGMPSPLPDLSIQYADFAYWQRQYLQGDLFTKQLAYWQQQLAGVPKILALPTDKPRPKVQSFQGATTKFELPLELSESIKKVSQSEGVTLFMMLLTGFQILLYCYSQQQDFCIGSPIANRNQRETEGIMGFFINTLVLRANSSGNPSFRELLQRVRETAIGAFAHQDLPFEKLLEELEIERSLSHNPLFQVWFVFNNVPMSTLEMPEFNLTPLQFDNGLARHDIRLGIWETATGFSGSFQYKTDLFDAETINSMVKDLEVIFVRLVADVDMKLSEMSDIIQASQKQKQILQKQELEKNNRQKLKNMKRKSAF